MKMFMLGPIGIKVIMCFQTNQQLAVENRFQKGEPLSCFCLDDRCNEVHVAFKREEPECRGENCKVTYLSFRYQTSQMYTHDTGMQIC
jgi:hypothetical protein